MDKEHPNEDLPKLDWGQISENYLKLKKEQGLSYHEISEDDGQEVSQEISMGSQSSDESLPSEISEEVISEETEDTKEDDQSADEEKSDDTSVDPEESEELEIDELEEEHLETEEAEEELANQGEEEETLDVSIDSPLPPPRFSNATVLKASLVLLLALLSLMFGIFMVSPYAKTKHVVVSGSVHSDAKQVLKDAGITTDVYAVSLLLTPGRFEKQLRANNLWIKDATLRYHFPFSFDLSVTEHDVMAYGQTRDGLKPILSNGLILASNGTASYPAQFTTITISDATQMKKVVNQLKTLTASQRKEIQIIGPADKGTRSDLLLVEMVDGNSIRVPLSQIGLKLPYYDKIKGQLTEMSIVDMEVGIYVTTAEIEATKPNVTTSTEDVVTDTSTLATTENTTENAQVQE